MLQTVRPHLSESVALLSCMTKVQRPSVSTFSALNFADTVDKYLRDLMVDVANEDDGIQEKLMDAAEQKGTFESDEKAINKMITQVCMHVPRCVLFMRVEQQPRSNFSGV
jgi:hypothetical protein